jgi:hypothetical protein
MQLLGGLVMEKLLSATPQYFGKTKSDRHATFFFQGT